jgi:hypothetical protein
MNKPWMKKMFTSLFKRKAQNRDQDYELPPDYYFKTVLLGDCNSGKTTLAFKFSCIASKTSYLKRPSGLNINTMEYIDSIIHVAEKKVLIRLYDTAGKKIIFFTLKIDLIFTFKQLIYFLIEVNATITKHNVCLNKYMVYNVIYF